MALSTKVVPFGRGASRVLRDEIAQVQRDDPLAPVTVVVPRNAVGLATRRLLASGDLGIPEPAGSTGRVGVVNIRFVTLPRLAEQIAGDTLAAAGRLPATSVVLRAVVQSVLSNTTEPLFRPIRDHPATTRALVDAYRDLGGVSAESLRRLATGSTRVATVVQMVEEVRARLGSGWYDEGQLIDAVAEHLSGARLDAAQSQPSLPPPPPPQQQPGPARSQSASSVPGGLDGTDLAAVVGAVLVYLPLRLSSVEERFLVALANHVPVTVLVGMTGDDVADETSGNIVDRLSPSDSPFTAVAVGKPLVGTAVRSAPSADAEVRMAVREVMERRRAGTRFEQMAIAHGGSALYDRLVKETLASASIPFNGVSVRPLAATVAGRTLLGIFDLEERGWHRDEVMAWIASGPMLQRGNEVPATAWDLLSRQAGVTSGLDNWTHHLEGLIADHGQQLAALDGPTGADAPATRPAQLRHEMAYAADLLEFVNGLSERLTVAGGTWAQWASWATALLDAYLGRPTDRRPWPSQEEEALTAIRVAVDQLSVLDRLEAPPNRSTFRQAIVAELTALAPQTSRFGTGVLVGPVGLLVGLDLDAVFILGMVDGMFPVRAGDDPLVPDAARSAAGADIPLRGRRTGDDRRDYLAALSSAPVRVLSFARGDHRRGREQRPARWLLDTLGTLEGRDRRLFSRELNESGPIPGYRMVPSFTAAVRAAGEPMSLADRDLRDLLAWRDAGHRVDSHVLAESDPVLAFGFAARLDRQSHRFTRFDGRIHADIPSPVDAGALSPTSLETYAECPRRYLMERLLRIEEHDRPESIVTIDPSTKGTIVHAILEQFIAPQLRLPRDRRIQPTVPWSSDDHARLDAIAGSVFVEYERQGLTGRPLLWGLDRATILRELHRFLIEDDRYRAAGGLVPEQVELRFGPGHGVPVTVELPDGRTVAFKGYADRVDVAADGSISVLDYKTGRLVGFRRGHGRPRCSWTKASAPRVRTGCPKPSRRRSC